MGTWFAASTEHVPCGAGVGPHGRTPYTCRNRLVIDGLFFIYRSAVVAPPPHHAPFGRTRQDYRHATTQTLCVLELCVTPPQETFRPQDPTTPTQNTTDKPLHYTLRRAGTPGTARRVVAHASPLHQPQPQDSSTDTHAALRTARTAPARPAPPLVAAPPTPGTPRTNDDARRRKDAACVPTRTQSRRRRSMGYGKTGRPPRQRGARLVPLMRACLTSPHRRRHKAPPQPCALTTSSS